MPIVVNYKIENTQGFLGTGIWPHKIGIFPHSMHGAVYLGDKIIHELYRDYVSFLYIPLFPMRLAVSALVKYQQPIFIGIWMFRRDYVRIPLDRKSAVSAVENASYKSYRLKAARKSWLVAFVTTIVGVIGGRLLFDAFALPSLLGSFIGCGLSNRLFIWILYHSSQE